MKLPDESKWEGVSYERNYHLNQHSKQDDEGHQGNVDPSADTCSKNKKNDEEDKIRGHGLLGAPGHAGAQENKPIKTPNNRSHE